MYNTPLPFPPKQYLEALTAVDQHAARDFGKLQVELTAEYHPERLMNFLRTSNYVPLKDAMKICEERKMIPEMVFLLQRVGNTTRALDLIISELGDVEAAIDFAKDVNDDELWDQLIKKSLDKPGLEGRWGGCTFLCIFQRLIQHAPNRFYSGAAE